MKEITMKLDEAIKSVNEGVRPDALKMIMDRFASLEDGLMKITIDVEDEIDALNKLKDKVKKKIS